MEYASMDTTGVPCVKSGPNLHPTWVSIFTTTRTHSEIISEMEEATGISAQALMALRPGMDAIREKLRLASTRQTARVEDAAYSLLGIFSSLPITYGEGDKAFGRLLVQLLTSSGDTSILAWTGRRNMLNSCLPSNITVFCHPPTSHIPPAISDAEMVSITSELRSFDLTLLTTLYNRVHELLVPSFSGHRMRLPCLGFKVGQVLVSRNGSGYFRAQTKALGIVEIQTQEDLSRLGSLCLVHPWIDFLLDRQPVGSVPATITEENTDNSSVLDELSSFHAPSNIASTTRQTRAAEPMSRIGLPFDRHWTIGCLYWASCHRSPAHPISHRQPSKHERHDSCPGSHGHLVVVPPGCCIASAPVDSVARGKADACPAIYPSTQATIWCSVTRFHTPQY